MNRSESIPIGNCIEDQKKKMQDIMLQMNSALLLLQ